ncbi:MAG: SAM-dependent DNA methyltransferase [Deltaproteobacteria bacterium]|nr:SAM-dependent DNA methyltransferase [Deltaproteobacteria bacterium]
MTDHGFAGRVRVEFGDFQTPPDLASSLCLLLRDLGCRPASIIEPTCGTGAFVRASLEAFAEVAHVEAADINTAHLEWLTSSLASISAGERVSVQVADFFQHNWRQIVAKLPEPVLIIGNPPWVTNSGLGVLGSGNLPEKSNLDGLRGIEALTGKSNFDISEWMLRQNIEWLRGTTGMLAVLCKTAVARKVLQWAWRQRAPIGSASLYRIDAKKHFAVSVDACFLVVQTGVPNLEATCLDYPSLQASAPSTRFGFRDDQLLADVDAYNRLRHLRARGLAGWRSGVKHDCSKVFEFGRDSGSLRNGLGEMVELEEAVVFPLLKSSDLANRRSPTRWLLVPQRQVTDDPSRLSTSAPNAWRYLNSHAALLEQRSSSIYRGRPPFSIFGIGPYSFAPWKVAISGLYKRLSFTRVAPHEGKPVLFDDTCYFFPCETEEEVDTLMRLLESRPALELLSSLIFWDAKRPITAAVLNSLDLSKLSQMLGETSLSARILMHRQLVERTADQQQFLLRESAAGYHGKAAATVGAARGPTTR